MTLQSLIQALVNGISSGGLYALMALSLTLIFGVTGILNFAHGDLVVFGSMMANAMFLSLGLDPLIALLPTFLIALTLGTLTYQVLVKYAVRAIVLNQIVITYGLLLIMENIMGLNFGKDYKVIVPPYTAVHYTLGGIVLPANRLAALMAALTIAFLMIQLLNKTYTGLAMRAVAQDKDGAALMGIRVDRIFFIAWSLGVGIAGVAGVILAIVFPFNAYSGLGYVLKSFSIVALGGLGSVTGSIIGGLMLGLGESLTEIYGSRLIAEVLSYMVLVVVLVVKPTGLFGKE